MSKQWWIALASGAMTALLPAQRPAPPTAELAIAAGTRLLLEGQERYLSDPRVGRMPDDQLGAWQTRERQRLIELRRRDAPGVEWPYEGVYRVDGTIPAGYRVGGSAIVCAALIQAPGFAADGKRIAAVSRSMSFMLAELQSNPQLAPGPKRGYDVRGWAHIYALDLLLLVLRHDLVQGDSKDAVTAMVPHLLACIAANEISDGGWNYANNVCSPFMTGSTLLALYQAKAQGFDLEDGMITRALAALDQARAATGAFVYSGALATGGGSPRTAMPGAAARAAICELCLYLAGRSDQQRLRVAVDAFFQHWDALLARKSKQGTHEGPYAIAPYYFLYGHTYAALAIEYLDERDRPALRRKLQETLWKTREADGSWNDRIFPRSASYSTAMALLSLLAPQLDRVAAWRQPPK